MRRLVTVLIALSLGASSARASDNTSKSREGGVSSGTSGSVSGGASSGATSTIESTTDTFQNRPDLLDYSKRRWRLDAVWETHAMLIPWSSDHEGLGSAKLLNLGYLTGQVRITPNNRVSMRMGMYVFNLADGGESGVRATDLSVTYTRLQPLQRGFLLRFTASATAPTSFASWHDTGLITALTGSVIATYQHKWLTIDARGFGTGYIQRYASALGGNPNAKASAGGVLSAEIELPFWKRLSLGAEVYDEYSWLYDIDNGAPNPGGSGTGGATTKDQTFGYAQPTQQVYGGEVFAELHVPDFKYAQFDLHVAYAQGDPTLGYTSILHDGVAHIYPAYWRLSSEVYAALTAHF